MAVINSVSQTFEADIISPYTAIHDVRERAQALSALHASLSPPLQLTKYADGASQRRTASVPRATAVDSSYRLRNAITLVQNNGSIRYRSMTQIQVKATCLPSM